MRFLAAILIALTMSTPVWAAPTDDIADLLALNAKKPITVDSLPGDFARLTKFVRHDADGMVLFSDGGAADGYVRHAQARYDIAPAQHAGDKSPLFSVAFEFANEENFTFEGLSAALAQRLGTPAASSNQTGATFRTWLLDDPRGRSVTIATAQASDNGDPITIVQIIQQ